MLLIFTLGACASGSQTGDADASVAVEAAVGDSAADAAPDRDAAECGERVSCRRGAICCAEGEECVDDRYCRTACEVRCGDNGEICCDSGEVCLDGVVCARACAATEALCGVALDTCCAAGEVCIDNACTTPGEVCRDDFDCLADGVYCETAFGEEGRCFPVPDVFPACEVRPDFDTVSVSPEWHWTGITIGGKLYENVTASPVVGDVSGDGYPDVVVPVYAGANLWTDTILVALDGRSGTLLWSVGPALGPCSTTVALANFEPSDDALEIVYSVCDGAGGIRVIDGDGTPTREPTELGYRSTGAVSGVRISPTIADLNADGRPDILAGCVAFDGAAISGSLTTLFSYASCMLPMQTAATTVVANLDADPQPEITSGGVALNHDGTELWTLPGAPHGLVAVADLDVDGDPDVISVRSGALVVREGSTGALLVGDGGSWIDRTVTIPGGGLGGAPTVADFDDDGLPEIATAGQGQYVVYDPDCLAIPTRADGECASAREDFILWTTETQDLSSSSTGSSVFDFQGDGAAEVIYNDECTLRIYDGTTGATLVDYPNSSRTVFEYPLVVDVDRDGNSEIVVPANRDQVSRDGCEVASAGVIVLGDPDDRWVRTRPIWNQFAYHVTNVGDRGETPAVEDDNWSIVGLNNYRQNVQGAAVFNAPNLQITLDSVARCGLGEVRLLATVRNAGSRGVPAGVPITFGRMLPEPATDLATVVTTEPLLPGGTARVSTVVSGIVDNVELRFVARVGIEEASTTLAECNVDDNGAMADELCLGLL